METREIGIVVAAIAAIVLLMGIISMVRSSAEANKEEETVPVVTSQATTGTTNYWDYYKQKHPETTEILEPAVTELTSENQDIVSSEGTEQTDATLLPEGTGILEETGVLTEVYTETGMAEGTATESTQTKKTAYTLIVTTKG